MNEHPNLDSADLDSSDLAGARALIADVLASIAPDVQLDELDPDGDLQQLADIDSMDYLSLIEGIAARLGIDIPEVDYPELATLSSAVGYVARRTANIQLG